jgi:hypothetical protein
VPSREGERTGAAWRKRSRAATEAALRTVRTDSFTGNDTRPTRCGCRSPDLSARLCRPQGATARGCGATAPRVWRDGPAVVGRRSGGVARRARGGGAWPRDRCVQMSMHVRLGGRACPIVRHPLARRDAEGAPRRLERGTWRVRPMRQVARTHASCGAFCVTRSATQPPLTTCRVP